MKYKFLILAGVVLFLIVLLVPMVFLKNTSSQSRLKLTLIPSKPSYMVGEMTDFKFDVSNPGVEPVSFRNSLKPKDGYLKINISKEDGNYKEYIGPRGAIVDASYPNKTLNPNESVSITMSIFLNAKPIIPDSFSADSVKSFTDQRIMSYYAFPEAGTYNVKAAYVIFLSTQREPITIESVPVQIKITEAKGDDLEVWNKIKESGDFACFLHSGEVLIPDYEVEERGKFEGEVESLILQYPKSFYTERLRQNLQKFRVEQERIRSRVEKLNKQSM